MSIAKEVGFTLELSDHELLVCITRGAEDWRPLDNDGFIVDVHVPRCSIRFTKDVLNRLEPRLTSSLIYLRDIGKLSQADELLVITRRIWSGNGNHAYYNPDSNLWEQWIKVGKDEDSDGYNVSIRVYKGTVLPDGTPVLTDKLGKLDLHYRTYEVERLYPGFNTAFTIVEQLGVDELGKAAFCQKHVLGLNKTAQPSPVLPDFE